MKIPPPTEDNRTELSVVPLVNVVFLLLIFFMLVGQISTPESLDIRPPRSVSGEEGIGGAVKVLLTRDGQIAVDNIVLPESGLVERAAGILAERPAAEFQIKADAQVDAVRMIRAMEGLRAAGVERLTLVTELDRSR
ncbi:MAG: biopolymer transporter ExbD [Gammaproteobacteria bacterium]|nr:biopolymer transporter ExbD [Gammaproteobacteria bacterium]